MLAGQMVGRMLGQDLANVLRYKLTLGTQSIQKIANVGES